ncbi:MAG: serine metalloprotease, partial [Rothia dentocariosa]
MSLIEHPTVKRTRMAALSVAGIASLMVGLCAPSAHAAPASPVSTKTGVPTAAQAEDILTATSAQQQEQGYDRFIINYADQAKNDLNISGLESGEYSEFVPELYQGIEKSVNSLDELLGVKTTYVRDTAQNDSVVSLSKPLNAQQAKQYMQTLAENPQVDSVEPDLKRQPTSTLPGSDKVDFNDPKMSRLWGFTAIKADYALKHAGDHQVTVAVIDTGIT